MNAKFWCIHLENVLIIFVKISNKWASDEEDFHYLMIYNQIIFQTELNRIIGIPWRIDNMRQYYCLVGSPTWSLWIGLVMKWPISKPSTKLAARMTVIGCQTISCSRFIARTKAVRWTQWLTLYWLNYFFFCRFSGHSLW